MLAVVLDAIGPVGQKNHKITVLDVCATPLKIAEWYAHERKTNIITRQADAKQTGFHAETFDLIVTDYFLTKLPLEDQAIVVSEWHRILKPEGRILTTIHLSSNHHGIQADESHIHQFSDKVERVALANSKSLRLDSKKMREYAEKYMRKNISYPIRDESELHHVFNGFELSIVSTFTSSVETIDSKTAQVVALKIG